MRPLRHCKCERPYLDEGVRNILVHVQARDTQLASPCQDGERRDDHTPHHNPVAPLTFRLLSRDPYPPLEQEGWNFKSQFLWNNREQLVTAKRTASHCRSSHSITSHKVASLCPLSPPPPPFPLPSHFLPLLPSWLLRTKVDRALVLASFPGS